MSFTVPLATTTKYGVIKVGSGLNVTDGVVSVVPGASTAFGYFSDNTVQSHVTPNTAKAVDFNTTGDTNNITDGTGNQVKTLVPGTFSIVFTVSINKPSGATSVISLWLQRNGIDVANSRQDITVANQTDNLFATGNYVLTLAANDYVQIMWSVTNIIATLVSLPATNGLTPRPALPSARITIAQI